MEYFENNIDVVRTYRQISDLFKYNFSEVRRGFSERNVRLFCSKHGIGKMDETELDAIIQDCV